jgi:hypothetical protein
MTTAGRSCPQFSTNPDRRNVEKFQSPLECLASAANRVCSDKDLIVRSGRRMSERTEHIDFFISLIDVVERAKAFWSVCAGENSR